MSYGSPAICEWSKVNLPSADLWTTHVCQAPSTVTRELRSEAAGSELVERLIAAAGGIAGLVPSGTEPIPVKRSWNSEHGLQAERSICRVSRFTGPPPIQCRYVRMRQAKRSPHSDLATLHRLIRVMSFWLLPAVFQSQ